MNKHQALVFCGHPNPQFINTNKLQSKKPKRYDAKAKEPATQGSSDYQLG
jgi:hypothetical protein